MVGARFATSIQTGSGAYLALGMKWQGHDMKHPLPSSVEVRERVELFLFSASAFRAGYRVIFLPLRLLMLYYYSILWLLPYLLCVKCLIVTFLRLELVRLSV